MSSRSKAYTEPIRCKYCQAVDAPLLKNKSEKYQHNKDKHPDKVQTKEIKMAHAKTQLLKEVENSLNGYSNSELEDVINATDPRVASLIALMLEEDEHFGLTLEAIFNKHDNETGGADGKLTKGELADMFDLTTERKKKSLNQLFSYFVGEGRTDDTSTISQALFLSKMKTKEEQFNDICTRVCTAIENQAGSEDTFKSADVATSHAKQLEKQNHALIFKEKASDAFESASFHFPYEIEHIGDDLSKYESLSAEQIDAEVKYLQEKISYLKARKAFIAAWTVRDMY
jgi:hypothetical protein